MNSDPLGMSILALTPPNIQPINRGAKDPADAVDHLSDLLHCERRLHQAGQEAPRRKRRVWWQIPLTLNGLLSVR